MLTRCHCYHALLLLEHLLTFATLLAPLHAACCGQVSDLAARLSAAEDERATAQTALAELRRELADRQLAVTAAHDATAAAEARAESLEAVLAEAQQQLRGQAKQLLHSQQQALQLQSQLEEAAAARDAAAAEVEALTRRVQQEEAAVDELRQQLVAAIAEDGSDAAGQAVAQQLEALQRQLLDQQTSHAAALAELQQQLQQERESHTAAITGLQQQLEATHSLAKQQAEAIAAGDASQMGMHVSVVCCMSVAVLLWGC